MSGTHMPIALHTLTEKLRFRYRGPQRAGSFDTYLVDLSDWKLSLSDQTPCIWVQAADIQALSVHRLSDSIQDVVRQKGWQNNTVLVFLDGEAPLLREMLPRFLPTYILINRSDQLCIQGSDSPTAETLNILLRQMSRPQLAPYETHKPVVGSQFFGREAEINKVLQHPNKNYLFIGIRRIGKTSLLKEIQRRVDSLDPPTDGQIRRLYIDCTVITSADEFYRTLAMSLDPLELKLLLGRAEKSKRYQSLMFDRFASLHGGPVTFLIDELDRLLNHLADERELFDVLRAASMSGKARFIMAGFRRPMRLHFDEQSPFYNFAQPIHLGKLKFVDVKRMVIGPMGSLRITTKNPEGVISRIYRETAGLPNYVQFYCQTLLDLLEEKGSDVITEEDLSSVYENQEFRDFILETFMANTDPLEQALVYALISEDDGEFRPRSYSQRMMYETLRKRKLDLKLEVLNRICNNLEVGGVFNRVGVNYEFAVPLLQRMLRETRDVEFLFEKTREEILAEKIVS